MTTITAPKIDLRNQQDLVRHIRNLIEQVPAVSFQESIIDDSRINTLVHIFARLMEINIQHLNKALDKNFIAFLDLLGISLSPPRPARVPLCFSLAKGTSRHVFVKKGTQIAAAKSPDKKPVVFETDADITAILPKLTRAVSLSPASDRWSDHSSAFFGPKQETFEVLFSGRELTPHRLYIGDSQSFQFEDARTVHLRIKTETAATRLPGSSAKTRQNNPVIWYRFDADSGEPVPLEIAMKGYDQTVVNLQKSGTLSFINVSGIGEKEISGIDSHSNSAQTWTNNWIFAELQSPISECTFPGISSIESRIELESTEPVFFPPEIGFFDQYPLDLTKDFYPFGKTPGFNSTFYLSSTEVFRQENALVTIFINLSAELEAPKTKSIVLQWEFWDGKYWSELGRTPQNKVNGEPYQFKDTTKAFTNPNQDNSVFVQFSCPPVKLLKVNGKENYWLRVRLISGKYGIEASSSQTTDYSLNQGFFASLGKLDVINTEKLTAEQIKAFDRLKKADFDIYSNFLKALELELDKSIAFENLIRPLFNQIEERYWKELETIIAESSIPEKFEHLIIDFFKIYIEKWRQAPSSRLEKTILDPQFYEELKNIVVEETIILTEKQIIEFSSLEYKTFPSQGQLEKVIENTGANSGVRQELIWVVVNHAKKFITSETTTTTYEATTTPPSIGHIALHYETTTFNRAETILSSNDFQFKNHTPAASPTSSYFTPFTPLSDRYAALYLGFDRSIAGLPVNLFFPLVSEGLISPMTSESITPPVLSWEYWNGKIWYPLTVVDRTKELTRREMVQLLAPEDVTETACFGEKRCWIRAVLIKGEFPLKIKATSIYTNAIWAYNRITVSNELLGTSTGGPDQILSIPHYPVLSGQKLLVRESSLTDEERIAIINEEGQDAVTEVTDDKGNILSYWIRWHRVPHFHASLPNSRHYIISYIDGKLQFGDGVKGMIPVAGKDNLKMEVYQYGGGERGNVDAGQVTKLLSSIPYLDKVTNPLPAEGGVNAESTDQAVIRGPRFLKTRNRAVTFRDYEWIVLEASPKVARAKCLAVTNPLKQFIPGWVTVIVVPDSLENKPMPSEELMEEVRNYLHERSAFNLVDRQQPMVNLIPPNYLRINVTITAIINSINEAKQVEARIQERLKTFYHPITGGPEGTGWEFGRDVHITELYEAIEKIDGINVIENIELSAPIQLFMTVLSEPFHTTYSFPRQSRVLFDYDKIVFTLAETIFADNDVFGFKIVGFMEGDSVEIFTPRMETVELLKTHESLRLTVESVITVTSATVESGLLQCTPVTSEADFPKGSIIETYLKDPDRKIRSYTLAPIKAGEIVSEIPIALPCPGQKVTLKHRDWSSNKVTLNLGSLESCYDRIFLPPDYLVYLGTVKIATKLESAAATEEDDSYRYLLNRRSGEIHDLLHESPKCNLDLMKKENKLYFRSLDEIKQDLKTETIDYCAWCFGRDLSKR